MGNIDKINIDYDRVIEVASNMVNFSERFVSEIQKVENSLVKMKSIWQGKDADSYVNKLQNYYIPKMKKLTEKLNEYGNFLNEVVNDYNSLENKYTSRKIDF